MSGQLTEAHRRMLEQPISVLELPVRTINTLENAHGTVNANGDVLRIVTVRDLLQLSPSDLLAMPNLGATTLESIYRALQKAGFARGNKFVAVETTVDDSEHSPAQLATAQLLNLGSFFRGE